MSDKFPPLGVYLYNKSGPQAVILMKNGALLGSSPLTEGFIAEALEHNGNDHQKAYGYLDGWSNGYSWVTRLDEKKS